jgi:hypothetical protein
VCGFVCGFNRTGGYKTTHGAKMTFEMFGFIQEKTITPLVLGAGCRRFKSSRPDQLSLFICFYKLPQVTIVRCAWTPVIANAPDYCLSK